MRGASRPLAPPPHPEAGRRDRGEACRLHLLRHGGVARSIDLEAESAADAAWVAVALQDVSLDAYDDYELWYGQDCILGRDARRSRKPEELPADARNRILGAAEALLNSRHAIARSRRLSEAAARLREGLMRRDRP
ncbi:MAG TPA: hypothetical protein VFA23_10770 [Dongiaceae bacterium]|nr:hypothetical protein [Dongiaceae bacterium]